MERRRVIGQGAAASVWALTPSWVAPRASDKQPVHGERVLRFAFPTAETGFDPQKIDDLYSRNVTSHIFEALFDYDHLARPFKIVPSLAAALPIVEDRFKTFTIPLKRGVLFQDDPAFGGKPREITADDWIYTFKRLYDPLTNSPSQSSFEEGAPVIGLRELRDAAIKGKRGLDYKQAVPGLQALDRYTLRVRLRESRPRFVTNLAAPDIWGVMAHEVVSRYGDKLGEHPVGTGPFMLKTWRRSSQISLVRNPTYRERTYDAQPNVDDLEGQALLTRFKDRRLPMLDRIEISIIEESQPRWLSFLNDEHDLLQVVPPDFISQAIPGGELAPHLRKRGVKKSRAQASDVYYLVFNNEHPLVGGNTPEKVALRRAVALGHDVGREIALVRRGEAVRAQGILVPGTSGFEPTLSTQAGVFDRARAKALLDLYGYIDRDGDGWREAPDGSLLTLDMLAQSDQLSRGLDEVFQKSMAAIGIRVALRIGQWAENLRACKSGKFMMWRVGSSASTPDGQSALERAYGGSIGKANMARFKLPAFDTLFDKLQSLPDGPERSALFHEANRLAVAYMPYRPTVHRILCDLMQARVTGYRRPPYWLTWWTYVDVEPDSGQPASSA